MRPLLPAGLATGLLAATLLTAPTAQAAGETCHGQPATIVGSPLQRPLVGTEGPDVVVTNGAIGIDTLGGDDLVCVTDPDFPRMLTLATGAGNDVVDASGSRSTVEVVLGAGADRYTASAGRNSVVSGANVGGVRVDDDVDVVVAATGGSNNQVGNTVSSGAPGVPNSDVIKLAGAGNTLLWAGTFGPGAQVEVGTDSELVPVLGGGDVVIDAATGTWTENGTPALSWTGEFSRFVLNSATVPRSLTLTGSERAEHVYSSFRDGASGAQRYDLGGGDDTLLTPDGLGGKGSSYDGGAGDDDLDLYGGNRLDVDLAAKRMTYRQGGSKVRGTLNSFEAPRLGAKNLDVRGTGRADDVRFYACRATVRGRAGKDTLESYRTGDDGYLLDCDARKSQIKVYGDGGRDTIRGSRGKDLLVGGPGRDTVTGKANRDRCSGEKLRSCEVKLR